MIASVGHATLATSSRDQLSLNPAAKLLITCPICSRKQIRRRGLVLFQVSDPFQKSMTQHPSKTELLRFSEISTGYAQEKSNKQQLAGSPYWVLGAGGIGGA